MILCKFTKVDRASFVPHLDMLRAVCMAIRRSGLHIEYSEGFNPHMQLYFTSPLPIGTQSECEYFCAYSNEPPLTFMEKFNDCHPSGVKILKAKSIDKNPNIHAIIAAASYEAHFKGIENYKRDLEEILAMQEFNIEYVMKGEPVVKNVRSMIYEMSAEKDTLKLKLACGNSNLRADRLAIYLDKMWNTCNMDMDILKKILYTNVDGKLIDIDKLFFD